MQFLNSSFNKKPVVVHAMPSECACCNSNKLDAMVRSTADKLRRRRARFKCVDCGTLMLVSAKQEQHETGRYHVGDEDRFLKGGFEYLQGNKYSKGLHADYNPERAFDFYLMSAELGNPNGQYNAGRCYLEGDGVKADFLMGYYWVGRAAEQGQGQARLMLPKLEQQFEDESNPKPKRTKRQNLRQGPRRVAVASVK